MSRCFSVSATSTATEMAAPCFRQNSNSSHGGIPIGAVQLGDIHAQGFSDLINKSLCKTSKNSLCYRGVQPFIGPRNINQDPSSSRLLLIHLPAQVATALDDGHPDLVEFLKEHSGVYLPGLRRHRNDATRRKGNANIIEPKPKSTNNDKVSAAAGTTAIEQDHTSSSFTFSELFAGIGGFRLGLEAIGGICVFANEIDPCAASIYRHNFSDSDCHTLIEADILDLCVMTDIPANTDILTGGFPCQPFSSRGKQRGLQDERGQLYREIVRVLRASHPKSFILENVSGLVSMGAAGGGGRHQDRGLEAGPEFQTILRAFEDCGYIVTWNICNSRHWTAQQRTRVFIVGIRNDLVVDKDKCYSWDWYDKILEADAMSTPIVRDIMEPPDSLAVLESELSANQWAKLQEIHSEKDGIEGARIDINAKAPTLISSYRKSGNYTSKFIFEERDGTKRKIPRFLTPRECCRIMGFPEDFHVPSVGSDGEVATTRFYSGIGNAVVPPVIANIGKELVRCLRG